MVGILVSFWDDLFSGAMLVSGSVIGGGFKDDFIFTTTNLEILEMIRFGRIFSTTNLLFAFQTTSGMTPLVSCVCWRVR